MEDVAPGAEFEEVARADAVTVTTYDAHAAEYAADWESQPADDELHALLLQFLVPGTVADIGCGSGRDTAWLAANGWRVIGYDASVGLLEQAERSHPTVQFAAASLPALEGLSASSFDNVYCETVIMHLDLAAALAGVRRLSEIVRPGGRIYLSWRNDGDSDRRDDRGRLYTKIAIGQVVDRLAGFTVLFRSEAVSGSSGKQVCRIIAERPTPE
jgi:2-polyprenyl-3-methyl-5-hydroxy-6-metoxy-1,4-benzoquinol methylase